MIQNQLRAECAPYLPGVSSNVAFCLSYIVRCGIKPILESFQAEMGKRILHLPKSTANNIVQLALKWPSIRAHVLCIKLAFLLKTMNSTNSLSSRVFCSVTVDDVEDYNSSDSALESTFNTNLTSKILSSSDTVRCSDQEKSPGK